MIVEIVNRSGRVIELHTFDKNNISIGRGYQSDLILNDPYLDQEHLEVSYDNENKQFLIKDQCSVNGTILRHSDEQLPSNEYSTQAIGTILLAGKTYLRFVDENYPVSPPLQISKFEPIFQLLSTWWMSLILLTALSTFTLYNVYAANPFSEQLPKEFSNVIFLVVFAIVYGGIWVLLAKIQHLDGRFLFNTNLLLALLCIDLIFELSEPTLFFNLNWLVPIAIVSILFTFIVTTSVVSISCAQTLHSSTKRALLTGSAIGCLLIISDLGNLIFPPDFTRVPQYNMTTPSPVLQWRNGISEEEFLLKIQRFHDSAETNSE